MEADCFATLWRLSMSPPNATAPTIEQIASELGLANAARILKSPTPGTATIDDLARANDHGDTLVELVDGTLVEKAMGYESSVVGVAIAMLMGPFVRKHRLGVLSGSDGFFRLPSTTRGPDLAFVSTDRLPSGAFPRDAYPAIAPNLVIEVLSPGNTRAEMERKRGEYFAAGVQLVWIVDCINRSVAIYKSVDHATVLDCDQTIDAGDLMPGWSCPVADFFTDLDLGRGKA